MRGRARQCKSAKILILVEELRRDRPTLRNRLDAQATAMPIAADPPAVLDAIKGSEGLPLAAEMMPNPPNEDLLTIGTLWSPSS
jgi:hypothetical protein